MTSPKTMASIEDGDLVELAALAMEAYACGATSEARSCVSELLRGIKQASAIAADLGDYLARELKTAETECGHLMEVDLCTERITQAVFDDLREDFGISAFLRPATRSRLLGAFSLYRKDSPDFMIGAIRMMRIVAEVVVVLDNIGGLELPQVLQLRRDRLGRCLLTYLREVTGRDRGGVALSG